MPLAALVAPFIRAGRIFPQLPAGELPGITFPDAALVVRVRLALGADLSADWRTWNWVDVTEWVRADLGIGIEDGRRNEGGFTTAAKCQLKLENDGRFSRRNPVGPYYGLLSRNNPIWIDLDPGSGYLDQFQGYVNEWPITWSDPSAEDSYVVIQCAGVLRRLAQGDDLQSALRCTMAGYTATRCAPIAYWPMEDLGVQFAPVIGTSPGLPRQLGSAGTVTFAASEDIPGSRALPTFSPVAYADLPIPSYTDTSSWAVVHSVFLPDGDANYQTDIDLANGNSINITLIDSLGMRASGPGFSTSDAVAVADLIGQPLMVAVHSYIVGATETFVARLYSAAGTVLAEVTNNLTGVYDTITAIHPIAANATLPIVAGHFAAYVDQRFDMDVDVAAQALAAYDGEQAHVRIGRRCHERGVPFVTQTPESQAMGPQPEGGFMSHVREAETCDQGVLFEWEFGLAYQGVAERQNAPVVLDLDFDADHIAGLPVAVDDDQRLRNQWSIRNANTGAESTARNELSIALEELYDDSDIINPASDLQLFHHASWRTHVDSTDVDRWPRIPINLAATPGLIPAWAATRLGSRVLITNPPPQVAQDDIDAVIEGRSRYFDTVSWRATLYTSPALPYQIGILDGDEARLDSGTSSLTSDIDSSTTSISVTTTEARDLWTTDAAEMGFDIIIGGEVMTVANIAGASSPQTFTVTRSVNGVVKAHTANRGHLSEVHVRHPIILAL